MNGIDISLIESIEGEAWEDLFLAAPERVKERFQLKSSSFGGAQALASRGIPITEFNRGLGLSSASASTLTQLVEWLNHQAAPSYALQIPSSTQGYEALEWAKERGFRPSGSGWSKLVLRSENIRALRPSCSVRAPHTSEPDLFGRIVVESFGLPEDTTEWFSALVGREDWMTMIAEVNGEPAGAAAMFVQGHGAWLGIDGTLPKYRRRGVQRALISSRLEAARRSGVLYCSAETGRPTYPDEKHTSRDNYIRCGFKEVYQRINLIVDPI